MQFVIRYCGITVQKIDVEPGTFTLGRGRACDIRVQLNMLSRVHGRLSFADGAWWYEDARPSATPTRVKIEDATSVPLGPNVDLIRADACDSERTREDRLADIEAALKAGRRGLSPVGKGLVALLLLTLVGGGGGGWWLWKSRQPMDAKTLLEFARPKIVEFELPRDSKGQQDLRRYAGLGDGDFTDTLGFCTGFIIGKNVVLTANHCLQGGMPFGVYGNFSLKTHDGKQHQPTRVLGFDVKRDFAFIEVPGLETYGRFELTAGFEVGEKVFTIGNVAGEGVAIRDGIMASKTPDKDDPSIEWLRYSAAASPGNSGGPLVDGFGKVVALVYARSSMSENYNLGTSGQDLIAARDKFLAGDNPKPVPIRIRDMLDFRVDSLLYALRIPMSDSWRENPEAMRPLEEIETSVDVPLDFASFTKTVAGAVNDAVLAAYDKVLADPSAAEAKDGSWESFLGPKTPMIVPGQFSSYEQVEVSADGRSIIDTISMLTPPCTCTLKFLSALGLGGSDEGDAETRPVEASVIDTRLAKDDEERKSTAAGDPAVSGSAGRRYTSDQSDGKRQLEMLAFRPMVTAHIHQTPGEGGWPAARGVSPERILRDISGKDGILASTQSPYVRPKAQREFTLKSLDETLREEEVTDATGRKWQVYTFSLFDRFNVETFCQPLPQGSICLTSTATMINPEVDRLARQNFARFTLSRHLVGPAFWDTAAVVDLLAAEPAAQDPVTRDFRVTSTPEGGLAVSLAGFGLNVSFPADDAPTSLRLNGGLVRQSDGKAAWVATGFQAYFSQHQPREICDFGVEVKDSNAIAVLHQYRKRAQLMKALEGGGAKIKLADVELPSARFTVKPLPAAAVPASTYAYCVPLNQGDESDQGRKAYDLAMSSLRSWSPDTKAP